MCFFFFFLLVASPVPFTHRSAAQWGWLEIWAAAVCEMSDMERFPQHQEHPRLVSLLHKAPQALRSGLLGVSFCSNWGKKALRLVGRARKVANALYRQGEQGDGIYAGDIWDSGCGISVSSPGSVN